MLSSTIKQNSEQSYRPDIDGLRAIAILAVVIFHAFPTSLKGGFVGVDIFFVISGYLITGILVKSICQDQFSIKTFYIRRIRRILPSLISILSICLVAGWFLLFPIEFKQLGKHVLASLAFVSNFVLLNESGYFDTSADYKPLLHLWSLAVEEQFYLIWPILLAFALKRSIVLIVIVLITIFSFGLNLWFVSNDPVIDFYAPYTRFWELSMGAWLCLYFLHRPNSKEATIFLPNVLSIFGFFLLLISFFVLNKKIAFPGFYALAPVVGACFLIYAGPNGLVNKLVLSNRAFVWIGLISYPLYLWHWPLLSFANILNGGLPTRELRLLIVLISFILSWLTYKFIEGPLRFRFTEKRSLLIIACSIVMLCILATISVTSHTTYASKYAPNLLNNIKQLEWHDKKDLICLESTGIESAFCRIYGDPASLKMAVIGDSTANALAPGIGQVFSGANFGVINLGEGSCPPFVGLLVTQEWGGVHTIKGTNCVSNMAKIYEYLLSKPEIDTVVMAFFARDMMTWGVTNKTNISSQEKLNEVKRLIVESVKVLEQAGKKVILTYDGVLLNTDPKQCITRPFIQAAKCENEVFEEVSNARLLSETLKSQDYCTFKQTPIFGDENKKSPFDSEGVLLLRDSHHLSYKGSLVMARQLKKLQCNGAKS